MIARRQRADEVQGAVGHGGLVGLGVLAGVVDQGEPVGVRGQGAPPGHQLGNHVGELADIVAVAGIGVADERDAAVGGDHQAQADQAQVDPLLLGVAPLGDRRPVVGRIDEGGEVGHVEHQPREVEIERRDHGRTQSTLDLDELRPG